MAEVTYEKVLGFWREQQIQTSDGIDEVAADLAVKLSYHNTKIEVPSVTLKDTKEIFASGKVSGYTGAVKPLISLQNAKLGWEMMMDAFERRQELSEELVKEFHYVLSVGTYDEEWFLRGERPGEYKTGDYVTGRYEIGALAEDVPEEMQELLEDLEDVEDEKALTAAAFFHAKFENIRAFADGNGRTGRLLMNYFLICHDHPVIIIHASDREGYMKALEQWDRVQELDLLKEFLKEQTVKTWEQVKGIS